MSACGVRWKGAGGEWQHCSLTYRHDGAHEPFPARPLPPAVAWRALLAAKSRPERRAARLAFSAALAPYERPQRV